MAFADILTRLNGQKILASWFNTLKSEGETLESNVTGHTGASSGVHGVTGNVVGTSDAQVLTEKDIDGGTASNTNRITVPKNTTANLAGLTRKEGTIFFDSTEKKFFGDDGTEVISLGGGATTIEVNQVAHGFTVLTPIFYNATAGEWQKAIANDNSVLGRQVIIEVTDADNFICANNGRFVVSSHGKTVDSDYFVSTTVAGETVDTEPINFYSNPAFFVEDANTIQVTIHKRPSAIGDGVVSDSEVGAIVPFATTVAPVGFLKTEGETIGNAASGATYASAEMRTLFNFVKSGFGNTGSEDFDSNDTVKLPDLRAAFLRGAGTSTQFTQNHTTTHGLKEDDAFQGHHHDVRSDNGTYPYVTQNATRGTGTFRAIANESSTAGTNIYADDPTADGTNGTPRTANETRPNNVGVTYFIRYAPKGALKSQLDLTETIGTLASDYTCTNVYADTGISATAPSSGDYLITMSISRGYFDSTAIQVRAKVTINGVTTPGFGNFLRHEASSASYDLVETVSMALIKPLSQGDVVKVQARSDSGWNGAIYADDDDYNLSRITLKKLQD